MSCFQANFPGRPKCVVLCVPGNCDNSYGTYEISSCKIKLEEVMTCNKMRNKRG